MRAAVLQAMGELALVERKIPVCGPGEVLVQVAYCGVCRTDRKAFRMGQRDLHLPRVLGHEIVGRIAAVGQGVKAYQEGQAVQVYPGLGCGECEACRRGWGHLCERMEILGFHQDGGFSEYCLVPALGVGQGFLQVIPEKLPMAQAALTEPLACAVNMLQQLEIHPGQRLLLVGGGVLGLLTALLARKKGLEEILLLEKSPYKQKIARQLGFLCLPADVTEAEIRGLWPEGADVAIPCCPDNEGLGRCLTLLKRRGKCGFFSGLTAANPPARDELNLIHYHELTVTGAYGCGFAHNQEALAWLEQGLAASLPCRYISFSQLAAVLRQEEIEDTIVTILRLEEEENDYGSTGA